MFSAFFALSAMAAAFVAYAAGDDNRSLGMRTRQYLGDLIRLDTSNPPGNESKVARYLKQVADASGIPAELLGDDPKRLNLVARLKGSGKNKPLLLMAHSDVVPAERKQWTVDPFKGEIRDEYLYGRGALDTKSLLAAELAVMVEIKRRNIKLSRDLILLSEADEEAGSQGIQWLIKNAWPKIDAEFAFNEGGSVWESRNGTRVFLVQTAEKIPTRVVLTARGPAGHGSLPRSDNAVLRLSRALVKLADADQPVRLTPITRRYLRELSAFPEYDWLPQLLPRLENPATVAGRRRSDSHAGSGAGCGAAHHRHSHHAECRDQNQQHPQHRGSPGGRPPVAERNCRGGPGAVPADRRRSGRRDTLVPGPQLPATESSPRTSAAYRSLERAIGRVYPRQSAVVPFMSRGATDGSFLRARGVAVYGVPIFLREPGESREHGNDERISTQNIESGAELLWQMVLETAGDN